jgi:hypothetical protein
LLRGSGWLTSFACRIITDAPQQNAVPLDISHARLTPHDLLGAYRSRILARPVTRRRLAGNSLLVYIDGEPGSKTGLTLWLEPTWHLRDTTRVLTGSREAQHDEDAEQPDAGFDRAAVAVDALLGTSVADVTVSPVTNDLVVTLTGGLTLQTFVSDPGAEELWHIRDNASGERLSGSPRGLRILPADV